MWSPDPWRRFYQRYWDGQAWTGRVADFHGTESRDSDFAEGESLPEPVSTVVAEHDLRRRLENRQVLLQRQFQYVGGFTRHWVRLSNSGVAVTVTDVTTYVDHFIKKKLSASLREKVNPSPHALQPGRHLLFDFPTAEISELLIQPFEAAMAVGGSGVSVPIGDTGVSVGGFGGGVRQQQWSGVTFVLRDGQRILFKTFGPPVTVQTELAAVSQFVHDQRAEPSPQTTDAPSTARYQALRELASLRDDGIITEEEFEREKTRILREGAP